LLWGGRGDDRLAGVRGDDLLNGDDELIGARGADLLIGGAGQDGFRYTDLDERGDRIADFTVGPDGDRLLIGELLDGFDASSAAADFVDLDSRGAGLIVRVNADGQGDDAVRLATLIGAAGASLEGLIADGNLVLTVATV
jgi:Ca2+-binding RTX toxin-like protein